MQTIWFNLDLHETCVLGIILDTKLTLLNSLIGFSHIKALTMFMMHCAAEYCDWIEDFMFLLFQRHIPRLHLVVECMKRWINHSDVIRTYSLISHSAFAGLVSVAKILTELLFICTELCTYIDIYSPRRLAYMTVFMFHLLRINVL